MLNPENEKKRANDRRVRNRRRGNENCRMAYKKCINFIANAEQKSSEDFVLTLRVARVHSEALRHQSSLLWGHSHHLEWMLSSSGRIKKSPNPELKSSDIEWPWKKGEKKIFFIVIFFSPINWMSPAPSSARCRLVLALLLLLFYYGFSTTHPHRRNIHSFISISHTTTTRDGLALNSSGRNRMEWEIIKNFSVFRETNWVVEHLWSPLHHQVENLSLIFLFNISFHPHVIFSDHFLMISPPLLDAGRSSDGQQISLTYQISSPARLHSRFGGGFRRRLPSWCDDGRGDLRQLKTLFFALISSHGNSIWCSWLNCVSMWFLSLQTLSALIAPIARPMTALV